MNWPIFCYEDTKFGTAEVKELFSFYYVVAVTSCLNLCIILSRYLLTILYKSSVIKYLSVKKCCFFSDIFDEIESIIAPLLYECHRHALPKLLTLIKKSARILKHRSKVLWLIDFKNKIPMKFSLGLSYTKKLTFISLTNQQRKYLIKTKLGGRKVDLISNYVPSNSDESRHRRYTPPIELRMRLSNCLYQCK